MSLLKKIAKDAVNFWRGLKKPGPRVMMLWIAADAVRYATGSPLRRVSEITPQLHLGGQYQPRAWPTLARRGVTAVVNMRQEFDGVNIATGSIRYLHLPTIDDQPPTLAHLSEGVAFITAEIERGGGVYIHCRSGVGRAATMTAAYLVSTGLTPEQAWTRIQEVRPFVCPTPAQTAQVERFAQKEKEDGSGHVPEFIQR
ncbi:MAG: dual specificity protein phosphatase family protein [Anaerolineae bacterium]|nr:dual specificity protein phosphatase family protein [Anaerolineae bacterium]